MSNYDLIVLGSGPGGYVAAIRAAQLGLKVAIVERENLGGICLNWGCIPTKALLRSAEIYHYMQHAGDYGLTAANVSADIDAVVKRSRGVAKQLNQGVTHLMKKNKITVHMGDGKLLAANRLSVSKDGKAEKALTKQGMNIMTGAGVESLKATASGVSASIKGKDGKVVASEFTHCIVAIGIVPNTENIGLEALGVEMDRGFLKTDANCRTNVPGLWAIGDITAPPWLAHKASHEGVIAAETIAGGHPHAMDPRNIPGCTYCHPQVASVGLTEAKAKEAGYDVKVGNFPFLGNGKAIALGEAEGFIKTVFDAKTGELLGAHMVGAEVTELIQGYTIGKTAELVEADFMHTVFPHPTLSEMMHESVLGAYGKMLHM
jgi:pyruvate/2-oxoglutarate dehydrogenase complex dihydrolipoamide dehydrogenase (E3) component